MKNSTLNNVIDKPVNIFIWFLGFWWPLILIIVVFIFDSTFIEKILRFNFDSAKVDKYFSGVLQIFGTLLILYSINLNLKLFAEKNLCSIFCESIRNCPQWNLPIIINGKPAHLSFPKEEITEMQKRLVALEKDLSNLRTCFNIEKSHSDELNKKLIHFAETGIAHQIFGVLLIVYEAFFV